MVRQGFVRSLLMMTAEEKQRISLEGLLSLLEGQDSLLIMLLRWVGLGVGNVLFSKHPFQCFANTQYIDMNIPLNFLLHENIEIQIHLLFSPLMKH